MKKMNEIKKLNPLLEAMNDIDDAIISESAPAEKKHARYFKPMMIAAAAAVLCAATAVTATASIKTRDNVTFNGEEPNDMGYDIYTDEYGWEIRTYTFKLPDYTLLEEVEGRTPVGKLRAAHRGTYDDDKVDWYLIDEKGNIFNEGVNNVNVEAVFEAPNVHDGTAYGSVGFWVPNFDYDHFGFSSVHNGVNDTLEVNIRQHTPFNSDEEESES
ncbi:MAG: hypothetical protein K2J77_09520 [Oscillospiraceae bacterium]|nr:hypothetical protein [Oscillospiraceae bacterium]